MKLREAMISYKTKTDAKSACKRLSYLIGKKVKCPFCRKEAAVIKRIKPALGKRGRYTLCVVLDCDNPRHEFYVSMSLLKEADIRLNRVSSEE